MDKEGWAQSKAYYQASQPSLEEEYDRLRWGWAVHQDLLTLDQPETKKPEPESPNSSGDSFFQELPKFLFKQEWRETVSVVPQPVADLK